jgi:hypothetical protein
MQPEQPMQADPQMRSELQMQPSSQQMQQSVAVSINLGIYSITRF